MTSYEKLKDNLNSIFSLIGFNEVDRVVIGGWRVLSAKIENENNFRKITFNIVAIFEKDDFEKLVLNSFGDDSFLVNLNNAFVVENFSNELIEENRTLLAIDCYQTYSEC